MANPNGTKVYVCIHPKFNMSVGGKLQRVGVGAEITLTDAMALDSKGNIKASLKPMIKLFKEPKKVTAGK